MEIIGIIAAIVILLWACSGSKSKKPDPADLDLRISRNFDGSYYIYDYETGETYGTFSDADAAEEYLHNIKD